MRGVKAVAVYSNVDGAFLMFLLGTLACAPMGIVIGVFFGNFLFVPILISLHSSRARVNRVGYEMRKRDPQFSHTEFYGLAQAIKKRTTCTVTMKRRKHVTTTVHIAAAGRIFLQLTGCSAV